MTRQNCASCTFGLHGGYEIWCADLAVVASIFFTGAAVGMCFGCVMQTVFVIQGCFCYC